MSIKARPFSPLRIGGRLTPDIVDRNLDRIRVAISDLTAEVRSGTAPTTALAVATSVIESYAVARATTGAYGSSIVIAGRASPGDGGEGVFIWVSGVGVDDDGTILVAPGGYWKRIS